MRVCGSAGTPLGQVLVVVGDPTPTAEVEPGQCARQALLGVGDHQTRVVRGRHFPSHPQRLDMVVRAGQAIGAAELPGLDRLLNQLIGRLIRLGESAGTASHEVAPVPQAGGRRCILVNPAEELP